MERKMKKFLFYFVLILSFLSVSSENYFKSLGQIKIKSNSDSIFVVKNLDYYSKYTLKPSKKGEFLIKTDKGDSIIVIEDSSENLLDIYFFKNLKVDNIVEYKTEIFQNYNLDDSLLVYLKKSFNLKKDYDSYSKLLDFQLERDYQKADSLLKFYYLSDTTNLNIIYKNSIVLKDMNKNEEAFNILKKATNYLDNSDISFNIALELIFDYEKLDTTFLNYLLGFTYKNFYKNEDFIYVLYQSMDLYDKKIIDDKILKEMEKLFDYEISDDVRFSVCAFFIDKEYSVEKSVQNLVNLYESDIYGSYGDWLNYYLAKGYLLLKDYKECEKYLNVAENEFNLKGKEIFQIGFDYGLATDDREKIQTYGIKLLSENMFDDKISQIVEKKIGLKRKDIEKKVYDYLKSQMDTFKLPDFEIENMNGEKTDISKIIKGKVSILNFFSSNCPYCKKEIPILNKIKESYKNNKNFEFLAISSDNQKEPLKKFINETNFSYSVFYKGSSLMDSLKIEGVPTIFIVDRDNKVRFVKVGYYDELYGYLKTRMEFLKSLK
uniref:TlpA family protein disulfide reductase n=1 Tax=candidate division WOR-3 bacterium TaxID=2052148 RepID=A0A7C3J611_UNCW3